MAQQDVPILTVSSSDSNLSKTATKAAQRPTLSSPKNSLENFTAHLLAVGMGHGGDDSEAAQLLTHVKRKKRDQLVNEPAPFFSFTAQNVVSGALPQRKTDGRRPSSISGIGHDVSDVIMETNSEDDVTDVEQQHVATDGHENCHAASASVEHSNRSPDVRETPAEKDQDQVEKADGELTNSLEHQTETESVAQIPNGRATASTGPTHRKMDDDLDDTVDSATFDFFEQNISHSPRFIHGSPDRHGDSEVSKTKSDVSIDNSTVADSSDKDTSAADRPIAASPPPQPESQTQSPTPSSSSSGSDTDSDSDSVSGSESDSAESEDQPSIVMGPQGDMQPAAGEVEVITGLLSVQTMSELRAVAGDSADAVHGIHLVADPSETSLASQQTLTLEGVESHSDCRDTSERVSAIAADATSPVASASSEQEKRTEQGTPEADGHNSARSNSEISVVADCVTVVSCSPEGDRLLPRGADGNSQDSEERSPSRRGRHTASPLDNTVKDINSVQLKENTLLLTTVPNAEADPAVITASNESLNEDGEYSYNDDFEDELPIPVPDIDFNESESSENELFASCIEKAHSVEVSDHRDNSKVQDEVVNLEASSNTHNGVSSSLKPESASFKNPLQHQNRFTMQEEENKPTAKPRPQARRPGKLPPLTNSQQDLKPSISVRGIKPKLKPVRTESCPGPKNDVAGRDIVGVQKRVTARPKIQSTHLHQGPPPQNDAPYLGTGPYPQRHGSLPTSTRQYTRVAKKLPILVSDSNSSTVKRQEMVSKAHVKVPSQLRAKATWEDGQLFVTVHGPSRILPPLRVDENSEKATTPPVDVHVTFVREEDSVASNSSQRQRCNKRARAPPKTFPKHLPVDKNIINTRAAGPAFITKVAPENSSRLPFTSLATNCKRMFGSMSPYSEDSQSHHQLGPQH